MTVRFASFNVENLFARPRAFNQTTWAQGQPILNAYAEFNALIEQPAYSPADKARMIQLLIQLDIYRVSNGIVRRYRTPTPKWAWLRANRGSFDVEHTDAGIEIVADGRGDWVGWLELATEPVDETSTRMTAQVIHDVGADIQAVVEAEDRPSLDRFNADLLADHYGHVMLIDGNDTRGIDVGILTSPQVEILSMRSNVDVPDSRASPAVAELNGPAKPKASAPLWRTWWRRGSATLWSWVTSTRARPSWANRRPTWPPWSTPTAPGRGLRSSRL
jgi:hypothetical protein